MQLSSLSGCLSVCLSDRQDREKHTHNAAALIIAFSDDGGTSMPTRSRPISEYMLLTYSA